jgi:Tat protein translocase TatB subunit
MGPLELLLILALALIVLGPAKLPEVARQIGRVVRDLRHVTAEVTREFQRSLDVESKVQSPEPKVQSPEPKIQSPESSVPSAGADTGLGTRDSGVDSPGSFER